MSELREAGFYLSRRKLLLGAAAAAVVYGCGERPGLEVGEESTVSPVATNTQPGPHINGVATAGAKATRGTSVEVAPAEPPSNALPFAPGELIRRVPTSQKAMTITVDDGPDPKHTIDTLNILDEYGIKGGFAMVGANVRYFSDVAQEVARRGHIIINHTDRHDDYSGSGEAAQVVPCQETIYDVTGVIPVLFRSAGLTISQAIQDKLAELNMANIFTSHDVGDWKSPRISTAEIIANDETGFCTGYISLTHVGGTSHQNTVDSLRPRIEAGLNRGYRFLDVLSLLALREDGVSSRSLPSVQMQLDVPPQAADSADGLPGIEREWSH